MQMFGFSACFQGLGCMLHACTIIRYHTVALACRWILSSIVMEEVKLDGNLIGDGGGREILQAMQERKEGTH